MTKVPYRRGSPKIGPNDPCPCRSGRKFKKCHGRPQFELPNLVAAKAIREQAHRLFEEHKAKELQRQKQQGLGRPIISIEHKGYRLVAVGNTMWTGKWKTFYDFLATYLIKTLGEAWGKAESKKPPAERHPVVQWSQKVVEMQKRHVNKPGEVFSMPITGASSAFNRLAYNLYLIAHNAKDVRSLLIERLRNKDNFQGAFFETQVAAWLIRAGFELEYEDESDISRTHCEFTATYQPTGEKYSVEAKSRMLMPGSTAPRNLPVSRQLRQALEKLANHKRIVFIELHKPVHTKEQADRLMDRAERLLQRAESGLVINNSPAPEAYVCLANLSDQYGLDSSAIGTMVSFRGFKIPDFMGVEFPTIRAAIRAREKHWPLFQLLKSMEQHRDIPSTFEGELPSEAFGTGQPPRIKIGGTYLVPGPDGKEVPAEITTAIVQGDKAMCAFFDRATGRAWLGTFPMTPEELADYRDHPDTYFGVHQKQGRKVETSIELFDFFFDSYKDTPRHRLLELLANAPDIDELRKLDQRDLAEIYSERQTYGAIAQDFNVKQPRPSVRRLQQSEGKPEGK